MPPHYHWGKYEMDGLRIEQMLKMKHRTFEPGEWELCEQEEASSRRMNSLPNSNPCNLWLALTTHSTIQTCFYCFLNLLSR